MKKYIAVIALGVSLSLAPLAGAQASAAADAGYYVGSGFGSLLYTPIKFASAIFMGVSGGLSLMGTVPAGAEQHSIDFVKLGMSGDWWISPDHLRGERPLQFMQAP